MLLFKAMLIVFGLALSLVLCPSIWGLMFSLNDKLKGRKVIDTHNYQTGLAIHILSVLCYFSVVAHIASENSKGAGGLGSLVLPAFIAITLLCWFLYRAAESRLTQAYTTQRPAA